MDASQNNYCTACKRSGSVMLRYCFNKLVCGSCKGAYYKYFNILAEQIITSGVSMFDVNKVVEFLLPLLKCAETERCHIKNHKHQEHRVNLICRRCRFLASVLVFDCKIPVTKVSKAYPIKFKSLSELLPEKSLGTRALN